MDSKPIKPKRTWRWFPIILVVESGICLGVGLFSLPSVQSKARHLLSLIPGWAETAFSIEINFTLMIAVLSLAISVFNAFVAWRDIEIKRKEREENLAEKSKKVLDIRIYQTKKYEKVPEKSLKWLGVWILIENRSERRTLLEDVEVVLNFKQLTDFQPQMGWLARLLLGKDKRERAVGFALYLRINDSHNMPIMSSEYLSNGFYMLDWESKTPIYFAEQNEYWMPGPKEMKRWYLNGIIPEEISEPWCQEGLYLHSIKLRFKMDLEKVEVEKRFPLSMTIDDDLLQKYSQYVFEFEPRTWALQMYVPGEG